MLKMLKKLMLINVKFQISILDFNFFHMDPPHFNGFKKDPGRNINWKFETKTKSELRNAQYTQTQSIVHM